MTKIKHGFLKALIVMREICFITFLLATLVLIASIITAPLGVGEYVVRYAIAGRVGEVLGTLLFFFIVYKILYWKGPKSWLFKQIKALFKKE